MENNTTQAKSGKAFWSFDKTKPTYIRNISCLCTLNGKNATNSKFRRGEEMQDIGVIRDGAIVFIGEELVFVGTTEESVDFLRANNMPDCTSGAEDDIHLTNNFYNHVINGKNLTVMPGFCDSHSHIVFAGRRADEFIDKLNGATYSEIAEKGGGIIKTVNTTRAASSQYLCNNAYNILTSALSFGTTSMEIKSGYCLNTEGELKQLNVVKKLKKKVPFMNIYPTFLGAHDFPPEYKEARQDYVNLLIDDMLPRVIEERSALFCDAFVDKGYYTKEEALQIFKAAKSLGLKIKIHADELADVDAASLAVDIEAISADHLLCISDDNIIKMANSETVATLLPSTAYCLRVPYAPARKLIDKGGIVALASDCNPGSSFTENMQFIMSLAVMNMKMSPEEAITAATINGAAALDVSEQRGSLEVGKKADLLVFGCPSYKYIFYHLGTNHLLSLYSNGTMHSPYGIKVWKFFQENGIWKNTVNPWAIPFSYPYTNSMRLF